MIDPLVKEVCEYISENTDFTFGIGNSDLKAGEVIRDTEGIFVIQTPSIDPDMYTPIEYYTLDFTARYKATKDGYNRLRVLYNFLHRREYYETDNFVIYYTHALSQIQDIDRDIEGYKLLRLTMNFIVRSHIS